MKPVLTNSQVISSLYVGKKWLNPQISFSLLNLNEPQLIAARRAIGQWDELIAPSFIEYSSGFTDIEVLNSRDAAYAHAYYPGPNQIDGSVVLNGFVYGADTGENNLAAPTLGQWGYLTLLHELGHALGLKHPGNYDAFMGADATGYNQFATHFQDSIQFSVMSYFYAENTGANHRGFRPQTPMIDDILAIQAVYGADLTTRVGNTTYGFNSSGADPMIFDFSFNRNPVIAVYDAGGIDTLDVSGWFTSANINLNPGTFSDANGMLKNISIARNTVIENAITGAGFDTITGNSAPNFIRSGAGDDRIFGNGGTDILTAETGNDYVSGGSGNDTIYGDEGNDTLFGSSGDDRVFGGSDNDSVSGGDGNDYLSGGSGVDKVYGGNGLDTLLGGSGNDSLWGGADADRIYGSSGNDSLWGGLGDDRLYGEEWSDRLYGEDGNDLLFGGTGNDFLRGGNGDDRLHGDTGSDNLQGEEGNDTLYGGDGNDRVWGGNGADLLYGGAGNDYLSGDAGRDTLYGGAGQDVFYLSGPSMSSEADLIRDFRAGDKLSLSVFKQAMAYTGTDIFADGLVSFGAAASFALSTTGEMVTSIFADINGSSLGGHIMIAEVVHLQSFTLSTNDFII